MLPVCPLIKISLPPTAQILQIDYCLVFARMYHFFDDQVLLRRWSCAVKHMRRWGDARPTSERGTMPAESWRWPTCALGWNEGVCVEQAGGSDVRDLCVSCDARNLTNKFRAAAGGSSAHAFHRLVEEHTDVFNNSTVRKLMLALGIVCFVTLARVGYHAVFCPTRGAPSNVAVKIRSLTRVAPGPPSMINLARQQLLAMLPHPDANSGAPEPAGTKTGLSTKAFAVLTSSAPSVAQARSVVEPLERALQIYTDMQNASQAAACHYQVLDL